MRLIKSLLMMMVILISSNVFAGKTYAPDQLRLMVSSGNYPEQGPLGKEQTAKMNWAVCLARTESIVGTMVPTYPAVKLVDTKLMTSTKVWVNDAAMTVTCYADGRLHITSASYL